MNLSSYEIISRNNQKDNVTAVMARLYLKNKWSVIPVNSREKKGSYINSWKPYQNKLASKKQIIEWWSRWPDAGIAIITGQFSGIIVLDIDPRNGGNNTIKNKTLPVTITVKTGGGGTHYYYKYPDNFEHIPCFSGENVNLPGLDLKGDGGFVYAPPSEHPSGNKYEFFDTMGVNEQELSEPPEWLIKVIKDHSQNKSKKITEKDFDQTIIEGNRNEQLTRLAGSLLTKMSPEIVLSFLKYHNQKKCKPPLPDWEVKNIVKSIAKREQQKKNKTFDINTRKQKNSPDRFFIKKRFIPKMLAKEIMNEYTFKYCYERFWVYQNGVYRPNGKKVIERITQEKLQNYTRNNRIKEVKGYIRRATYAEPSPSGKKLINLKNGRLDWKTGELYPHNENEFIITQIPVVYNPEADCPVFKQYLRTTLEKEIIPLIPEIIGYCLIPDTSFEKAIVLLGEGANGKSVFLNVLTALLGENNVSNSELQMLINNRFRAAELLGKLANISADIGNQRLENTERFKKLITGDRMTVEQKHKDPFEFNNYARLLFSANELPGSRDRTYAFYRRWLIIPFTRTFKGENADKNLTQKLVKELSGIFNLGLRGLKRLKKNNKFTEPQQVIEAKKKYKMQNDSVTAFINERIEESKDNHIIKKHLYNEYKKWCEEQGLKPVSHRNPDFKRAFYNSIDSLDEFRTNNGNGPWAWLNIELI